MKKNFGNIAKGWFTSIIGGLIMVATLVLIWTKQIGFVWEGIAGFSIGTIILLMPETIEKIILAAVNKKRDTSYYNDVTDVGHNQNP